jgi:spermidine/putrescine transport system permease protein
MMGTQTAVQSVNPTMPAPRRSARAMNRRRMLFWLLPPVAWWVVFMLIPYGMMFYYSLGTMDYLVFQPGFSLENFHKMWTTEPYVSVLLKSAKLGLLTAVLSSIIAYPLAFCLAFHVSSQRTKYLLYMLVIVPWWASYLVKAYAWKTILGTNGLINGVLLWLGITDEPLDIFLYNQFSVALTLTYIFTPFAVLSIYAQLERIPASLIEAARDQGADSWEIFRHIVLPISTPGILAGAVITFSLAFGDFVAPALVGGSDAVMISNIVINLLGVAFDWPMASAIGISVIALGLVLIAFAQWLEHRTSVRL